MRNKKGLSNIVATVLIILLAISAVVLIGYFVLNLIESWNLKGELSQMCLEKQVTPTSCTTVGTDVSVMVEFSKGSKENIAEIVAVVEYANGDTDPTSSAVIPETHETVTIVDAHGGRTPQSVTARVKLEKDGATYDCEPTANAIDCA